MSHDQAGLSLFLNAGDMFFNDPIKIDQEAHVERRSAGYGLRNSCSAMVCFGGCLAGVAGFLAGKILLAVTKPKRAPSNLPPLRGPNRPAISVPPVMQSIPRRETAVFATFPASGAASAIDPRTERISGRISGGVNARMQLRPMPRHCPERTWLEIGDAPFGSVSHQRSPPLLLRCRLRTAACPA